MKADMFSYPFKYFTLMSQFLFFYKIYDRMLKIMKLHF